MAISRYPHPGHRIAPATLREILETPIPSGVIPGSQGSTPKLSDLDETSWHRYSRSTCEKLGKVVVHVVASRRIAFSREIRNRHIPSPRPGLTIDDLELEVRTRNCIKKMIATGRIKSLPDLGRLTISQILPVHGFGAKCLVDLLSAVEAVALHPTSPHLENAAPIPPIDLASAPLRKFFGRLTSEAKKIKRSRWSRRARYDDPRLGPFLKSTHSLLPRTDEGPTPEPYLTAFDLAVHILDRKDDPTHPALLASQLRRLRSLVRSMSLKTLEDELCEVISSLGRRQSTAIVARREGWDGRGGCTLQTAGDEFGLTRERVRQICERFEDALSGKIPFTPVLDRAVAMISTNAPIIADDAEIMLKTKGLSSLQFRVEGLMRAVELKRGTAPFTISEGPKRIIFPAGSTSSLTAIVTTAKRTVTRWGIANIQDVAAQASEQNKSQINEALAARILAAEPAFRWLDQAKGWFRMCDLPRNTLLTIMEKVFSVAPRIEVGELRNAVSRHYRMQGFAPPRTVLLELCRQASGLRVEGSKIATVAPSKLEEALSETELTLVKVLTAHGPVMQREKLEDLCAQERMNRSTFYRALDSSPIIARYATGVYGLVGADVGPGAIQSLITRHQPQRVVVDFGWKADQSLWIGYRVSKNMMKTGTCGVPGPIQRFISGDFSIRDGDGSVITRIRSRGSYLKGLAPLFRRKGGEPGDHLLLVLDLRSKEIVPFIGDRSLLEKFQAPTNREEAHDTNQPT